MSARLALLLSIIAFITWIAVGFVLAVPKGWPHLFLVAAVCLVIYWIAKRDDAQKG